MVDGEHALEWVLEKMSAVKKQPKSYIPVLTPPLNPLEKKKELTAKKQTEIELWHTWTKSKYEPKHLDPLLKSLNPLISSHTNKFKNRVEIPTAAIDFQAKKLTVQALKTYDPTKGVQIGSWVSNHLKKLVRFVNQSQNIARIPENLSRHIGTYHAVKADLTDRLGHEPDDLTLAEEIRKVDSRIGLKEIKRLNKEIRKGLIDTAGDSLETPSAINADDRQREVVSLIWHQLTPPERVVHEYTFGINGKPELKTGQIAKKLGWDASKVSKLKTSIANKMKPHLSE